MSSYGSRTRPSAPPLLRIAQYAAAKTLAQVLQREEDAIRALPIEHGLIIASNGAILARARGTATEVNFTPAERKLARGAIVTHNHPHPRGQSRSFSMGDLDFMFSTRPAELRAVTPQHTHILRAPASGWPTVQSVVGSSWYHALPTVYAHAHDAAGTALLARVHAGTMTLPQANADHLHETWVRVAQHFGWDYQRLGHTPSA